MIEMTTRTDLVSTMWNRLKSPRENLRLDDRVDEEPEDCFRMYSDAGHRNEVVSALRELLGRHAVCESQAPPDQEVRFLSRAIRLCDAIQAAECKDPLKFLLLKETGPKWGSDLFELQELAARALLSLPKSIDEFRFWQEVAIMQRATCPYALNATLELDLPRGLNLCHHVFRTAPKGQDQPSVNWQTILWIARERHGYRQFSAASAPLLARLTEADRETQFYKSLTELAQISIPPPGPKADLGHIILGPVSDAHRHLMGSSLSSIIPDVDINAVMRMSLWAYQHRDTVVSECYVLEDQPQWAFRDDVSSNTGPRLKSCLTGQSDSRTIPSPA
ncbi:MAG: hypothetical protein ACYDH9_11785 [Limisphaerales bacterium]